MVFKKNKNLMPSLLINFNYVKPLTSLGLKIFIIQIAVLLIFSTDKILIAHLLGPEYVTSYDLVFKLFSIVTLAHSLILGPLWSSYTDAFQKSDFLWINATLKSQIKIFAILTLVTILVAILAKPVIKIWVPNNITVSTSLILSMTLFIIITTWNNIYAFLLNGIGKINSQIFTSILALLINIPLAIFLTKYIGLDSSGVVIATCISLSIFGVVGPLEVNKLLREKLNE